MQRGGGVFATGDHGALGCGLCGRVYRVRSMRYRDSRVVAGEDEAAVGAALVSLRQNFPCPVEKFGREIDEFADQAIRNGMRQGLQSGLRQMFRALSDFDTTLKAGAAHLDVRLHEAAHG